MADSLGDLKALIADDLNRSDLTTQIASEITAAISQYQSRRFYFNEDHSVAFSTVAAQEWYGAADNSLIPNLLMIDSMRVSRNGSRYQLTRRDYDTLERKAVLTTATGQPGEYAYYNRQLRLYPIPSEANSVNISAVVRLTPLSGDSSSNAWTTDADARDLIRYQAEFRIYDAIIKDMEESARAAQRREEVMARLEAETNRRITTGMIRPTSW